MVRAIFDFCPSVSEELPLFVGDVIEVLAVVDEFWLLGKKEDVTGKLIIHVQNGPSPLSTWKVKVKRAAEANRLQNTFVFFPMYSDCPASRECLLSFRLSLGPPKG